MKLYFSTILTTVLGTTGCAQVALYHDRADPCQGQYASPERKAELGRPADYKNPDYCFSSRGSYAKRHRIVSPGGTTLGYITK
jgi:hypothetical protein